MRVLVVVPTTGGPLVLQGLKPRPGLPASAAFAQGDYRPLPWSADYARLSGPTGPLAAVLSGPLPPHEARLSGSFDTGRSWEAPLALAHLLAAAGHAIVGEVAAADLVLWATGAVDLDLRLIPGDYALADKIEGSAALVRAAREAGVPLAVLFPPGPGEAQAAERLVALEPGAGLRRLAGTSLADVAATIAQPEASSPPAPETPQALPTAPDRKRPSWRPIAAVLLAGALAAVGVGALWLGRGSDEPAPRSVVETARPEARAVPAERRETAEAPLIVEEWHAPAGSSCRQVLFGAAAPTPRPVPTREGALAPSRLLPGLCGLAFRVRDPDRMRVSVGRELAEAALAPVAGPGGAQVYYLRQNLERNVVYAAQVSQLEGGAWTALPPVRHSLER